VEADHQHSHPWVRKVFDNLERKKPIVFELLLLLIVVAESRGFFAFEHSGIKEIEHLGIYRSQCKGRAAKDVAQVDELKEKEEISLHIFSFSSIHPFWPFSPFHAQNRLQLEESSGIDSRQHD